MLPRYRTVALTLLSLATLGLTVLIWVQERFQIVTLGLLLLCLVALFVVLRSS